MSRAAILKPFNRRKYYSLDDLNSPHPLLVCLQKRTRILNKEGGYALPYLTNEPNYLFSGNEDVLIPYLYGKFSPL